MPLRIRIGAATLLLLVILTAGGVFGRIQTAEQPDRSQWAIPPPGELVDVGGFRLHLYCQGEAQPGVPIVVLEAGGGDYSRAWSQVQSEIAGQARVCAYDRAGYGWSDPGPHPRTAERMASELRTLLANAGIAPPYVLVAHSFGGFPARRFAIDYPQDITGLILVDVTDETVPLFIPVTAALAVGLRVEALRAALNPKTENWSARPHGRVASTFSAELMALAITIPQVQSEPEQLGDLPLIVISASLDPETDRVTMGHRDVMTKWSRNSRYVFVESGHALHQERPEVIVHAILTLLDPFREERLTIHE